MSWNVWFSPPLNSVATNVNARSWSGDRVRKHIVDTVAAKGSKRILVSLKWQQVSGTAEQKVPFEVICLSEAVAEGDFATAYLVLGGDGWTLRDAYTQGALDEHLRESGSVHIVALERFIALANQGRTFG